MFLRLVAVLTAGAAVFVAPAVPAAAAAMPAVTKPSTTKPSTPAATPPMGFNDWNAFGCDVDDSLIRETADAMVANGMAAAGYRYVNIDDCWSLHDRDTDGRLVPDPVKFPEGIKGVADYVHGRGLKLGIYGDAGTATCAGYPGSLGHERVDAQTWADWGVDYLKYDNCNNQSDGSQADYIRRYTAMHDALQATGRSIVLSICEWGTSQPWTWAPGVGQLWRTTGDITDDWSSVRSIIAQNAPLAPYAGPGHWNDPDMLEVGNGGMTDLEYRTHMSMWAMMAAPLIAGSDLRTATAATLRILTQPGIIAIDQDRLGVPGSVVRDEDGLMVLDKPLTGGDRAIALYNSTDRLATVGAAASATGLAKASGYQLDDVWTGARAQAKTTISAAVPPHGTVVYRVRPLRTPGALPPSVTLAAGLGTLVPGTADNPQLTSAMTNRGAHPIREVTVRVDAPTGWRITPTSKPARRLLDTDATWTTNWTVSVPETVQAGSYPVTVSARYRWGPHRRTATATATIAVTVVTAPPDGRWFLGALNPFSSTNASGPIETDQAVGGPGVGDGGLLTIGGRHYTRGLGTAAASEIVYFLGGRCSALNADVGVDDQSAASAPVVFTAYVDGRAATTSGPLTSGDKAVPLSADLTGARSLRLVAAGGPAPADWANAILTCGNAAPTDPAQPSERTLFSFEAGTDGFTIANPGPGGTVAQTSDFATEGTHGLAVSAPVSGNWFGRTLDEPLDLSGRTAFSFDVRAGASGTSGEVALQVGEAQTWCQGGHWAWTNAGAARTITETVDDIECPSGIPLDLSDVRGIWIFLNGGGTAEIDNIRAR
jgi:alpha-galactosidase